MPNITVCAKCGQLYEAGSEESANEPIGPWNRFAQWCPECFWEEKRCRQKLTR